MATAVVSQAFISDTDANFRLWGKWVSDRLAAFGWVQAADTGQINWATVTKPAGVNASQGYEIWKLGDALQATAPMYLKLEYGSSAGAATTPALYFTISNGSDGAGTLTGSPTTRKQIPAGGSSSTAVPCHASGSTSRASFGLWSNSTSGFFFVIERTHDTAGADTGTGILIFAGGAGTSSYQTQYEVGVGPSIVETTAGVLLPSTASMSKGSSVQVASVFLCDGNMLNPLIGAMVASANNFSANTTVAISAYGVSHTYFVLTICTSARTSAGNTFPVLIRFE
jgi:hypothetical protein